MHHTYTKGYICFLLFLSSFISLKSVGTKEMTIFHSFLAFVFTAGKRKRDYEVFKKQQLVPKLMLCFWLIVTDFQNEAFSSARYEPNQAFYWSKSELAHCKLTAILEIKNVVFMPFLLTR